MDSIEQVDIVFADVSTATADFTSFSPDGADDFSSSGGGGDAGDGSGAGGW